MERPPQRLWIHFLQRTLETKSRLVFSSAALTAAPHSSQTAPVGEGAGALAGAFAGGFATSFGVGGASVGSSAAGGSSVGGSGTRGSISGSVFGALTGSAATVFGAAGTESYVPSTIAPFRTRLLLCEISSSVYSLPRPKRARVWSRNAIRERTSSSLSTSSSISIRRLS